MRIDALEDELPYGNPRITSLGGMLSVLSWLPRFFYRIDISHGDEGQPSRLPMLIRRYLLVNQPCDGTSIEKCLGVPYPTRFNILKCPAKQSCKDRNILLDSLCANVQIRSVICRKL